MSDLGPGPATDIDPGIPTRDLRDAIRLDQGQLPIRAADPDSVFRNAAKYSIKATPHYLPAKGRLNSNYTVPVLLIIFLGAWNIWLGVIAAAVFAVWAACRH